MRAWRGMRAWHVERVGVGACGVMSPPRALRAWSQVFDLLHANFEQLRSIFDYYAKSGTAGAASAGALLTMQQYPDVDRSAPPHLCFRRG